MNIKQKQYRHFKKCVEKWVNFFGLKEYSVTLLVDDFTDSECRAEISTDCQNAIAVITFYPESYNDFICEEEMLESVDKTAFHEVCHLLLARVMTAAKTRFLSPDSLEESEEMIIRRLENTVYPLLKKEKMLL